MLASLMLASLLAASPPAVPVRCPPVVPPVVARLGPATAPRRIEAYIDPVEDSALATYLELRRLVAEHDGELAVSFRTVPSPAAANDPRQRQTRAWAVSMAKAGRLLPALRLLSRDGSDRIFVRLRSVTSRASLAKEVGLPPPRHEAAWQHRCEDWPSRQEAALQRELVERGTSVYRLPVFLVDDELFEDGSSLDKLRSLLGRQAVEERRWALRPRPVLPSSRPMSEQLRHPELRGALFGGVGLPHLFVLMARDEDDPNLFMLLPPVLEYRRQHPGRLAVRLVARGGTVGAMLLRHRLCAARRLGLVAAYVDVLATEPSMRLSDPAAEALGEELDRVPEEACEQEPDPAEIGLPDGGWLDGIPRTRSELDNLETTLELIEAADRPLSPLLRGEAEQE